MSKTSSINEARAAALAARQGRALDKPYRFSDGGIHSFRTRIDGNEFTYRVEHYDRDGRIRRGLITPEDAAEGLSGAGKSLAFSAYAECPKLVFDYANSLPIVIVRGYNDVTIVPTKQP
jgi:hypothetical protein